MRSIFGFFLLLTFLLFQSTTSLADSLTQGLQAYKAKNYTQAREILLPLAEKGETNAMYYIGQMYDNGLGVETNFEISKTWYERAGTKGHPKAAYLMSLLSAPNTEEAIKWAKISAEKNYLQALKRLGDLYWLQQEHNIALEWYKKAALKGSGETSMFLGDAYKTGAAGKKNLDEALKWLKHAIHLKFYPALGSLYNICLAGHCSKEDIINIYKWKRISNNRKEFTGRKAEIYKKNSRAYKKVYEKIEQYLSNEELNTVEKIINNCKSESYLDC